MVRSPFGIRAVERDVFILHAGEEKEVVVKFSQMCWQGVTCFFDPEEGFDTHLELVCPLVRLGIWVIQGFMNAD
jgi:hypothetical protein